jgi:predicted ATPase
MQELERIRVYRLDAEAIAQPVNIVRTREVAPNGHGLANVLDRLRDKHNDRLEQLNDELGRFLPEFDRILLDVPMDGVKEFLLRTREGRHPIPAKDLSHGTLLALVLLTLANLPELPPMVCIEEPDRGIHPRLLRRVQDALYRLSHPEASGEKRPPVQVVVTTQSPYFLNLFREHPEEVVIAEKVGLEARFSRLTDRGDIEDILAESSLGAVWYSGVLGGVPVNS